MLNTVKKKKKERTLVLEETLDFIPHIYFECSLLYVIYLSFYIYLFRKLMIKVTKIEIWTEHSIFLLMRTFFQPLVFNR